MRRAPGRGADLDKGRWAPPTSPTDRAEFLEPPQWGRPAVASGLQARPGFPVRAPSRITRRLRPETFGSVTFSVRHFPSWLLPHPSYLGPEKSPATLAAICVFIPWTTWYLLGRPGTSADAAGRLQPNRATKSDHSKIALRRLLPAPAASPINRSLVLANLPPTALREVRIQYTWSQLVRFQSRAGNGCSRVESTNTHSLVSVRETTWKPRHLSLSQ